MKHSYRNAIIITISILLTTIIIWYAPTFQNLFSHSSYTEIKVIMGQIATYDQGNNHWGFFYRFWYTDSPNSFTVTSGFLTASYPTTQGSTYTVFGLEIKVSEANSEYIVLLVKPT